MMYKPPLFSFSGFAAGQLADGQLQHASAPPPQSQLFALGETQSSASFAFLGVFDAALLCLLSASHTYYSTYAMQIDYSIMIHGIDSIRFSANISTKITSKYVISGSCYRAL